ncbi:ATP-binding protein [Mesobacillus harenae]|uniref:ATP-binding protein n=1 Tax=Mesobacillus harenae TaxID=2213203 RepID=UPI00157FD705|nr:ATP-binding protein [Mesobacillus harenae]
MEKSNGQIDYKQLIPRRNGFVFKYVKVNDDFIHTFIEGDLLSKMSMTPEMVIGKTLCEFLPQREADRKRTFYEIAWSGETVNYEGSGGDVLYLVSLSPLLANSKVVEVSGTAIDITQEKKNEQRVRDIEKLALVGELAAGIAHEIRNPLTSITGFTKILKEKTTDQKTEEYLTIMLSELDRINTIVNEFMFIAKPKENMEVKEININDLISSVLQFMGPQFTLKNTQITTNFAPPFLALCDPNQIKQVIINLIQNSIESSENNNHVVITLLEGKDNYLIGISDSGSGITGERKKRLFEPFYTTKEKGTGMGLMVCKRIIENHNGTIEINSSEGEGTIVTLNLPKNMG